MEETKWAHTPLAEKGELLVAVLSVPAVQASFVHAFDLKALQLGAENVVLGGRRLPKIGQTLRWQKHLHRPWNGHTFFFFKALQRSSYRTVVSFLVCLFFFLKAGKAKYLCMLPPSGPPGSGSDWWSHTGSPPKTLKTNKKQQITIMFKFTVKWFILSSLNYHYWPLDGLQPMTEHYHSPASAPMLIVYLISWKQKVQ